MREREREREKDCREGKGWCLTSRGTWAPVSLSRWLFLQTVLVITYHEPQTSEYRNFQNQVILRARQHYQVELSSSLVSPIPPAPLPPLLSF